MHELKQINNGLYWTYIYDQLHIKVCPILLLHDDFLELRVKC